MTKPNLLDALPAVADRIQTAGDIFIGLDFDGTLAPIRSQPHEVELTNSIRDILRRLNRSPATTVMIVSGRGLIDVSQRVGLPELIYAGNHGLEIQGPGFAFTEPRAAALVAPLRQHAARLRDRLQCIPGALVEDKGLSLSVHDRNVVPELRADVERITREIAADDEERFAIMSGHRVWELRPRILWNKGRAMQWVLERLDRDRPASRLAFYIGDDRTDEDGFAAIPDGVTARVGPAEATAASYALADHAAVEMFLNQLAGLLAARR